MSSDDPRMRFRCWVAGELVDESWVDATNPEAPAHFERIQGRHRMFVEQADRDELPWLVEVYDPAKPAREAYIRIGTDSTGMVDPRRL